MTMKLIALAVVAFLAAATVSAQVYEWKDESGKTNYSDKPPIGNVRQQRRLDSAPPPVISTTQKTAADRELEFRKRQKEAQESAAKSDKDQAASAEKQENCANARRQLQILESGERVAQRDDKGERYFMDDARREQEIAKMRQAVESNCK
jgi:hypothetical protein